MNRVALITGGSGGIGRAISIKLAEEGYDVVINYHSDYEKALEVKKVCEEYNVKVMLYKCNISKFEEVEIMFKEVVKEMGRVDVLVNNSGITRDTLILRMSEEDFDKVIEVNLKSVFNMTKAVQRIMLKQRKGSIINMSSVVGVKGNAGQSNYAASKAGIIGFTKSIALELGSRNIRCNAIAPGFIETEMTAVLDEKVVQGWRDVIPLKRGGQPEDVANACVFLASEMSAYITGQVLNVDGGMLT